MEDLSRFSLILIPLYGGFGWVQVLGDGADNDAYIVLYPLTNAPEGCWSDDYCCMGSPVDKERYWVFGEYGRHAIDYHGKDILEWKEILYGYQSNPYVDPAAGSDKRIARIDAEIGRLEMRLKTVRDKRDLLIQTRNNLQTIQSTD